MEGECMHQGIEEKRKRVHIRIHARSGVTLTQGYKLDALGGESVDVWCDWFVVVKSYVCIPVRIMASKDASVLEIVYVLDRNRRTFALMTQVPIWPRWSSCACCTCSD